MLFKKGCDPCGFCARTGFSACAHTGGCWNQKNHLPDNYDPVAEEKALIGAAMFHVAMQHEEMGPTPPEELN